MNMEAISLLWREYQLHGRVLSDTKIKFSPLNGKNGTLGAIFRICFGGQSAIIKAAPRNLGEWADFFHDQDLLGRERDCYEFLSGFEKNRIKFLPVYYPIPKSVQEHSEYILVEDLTHSKIVIDFSKGLSLDASLAATRSLAELHSLCLEKNLCDGLNTKRQSWLLDSKSQMLIDAISLGLREIPEHIRGLPISIPLSSIRVIQNLNLKELLILAHEKSIIKTLCHGDCWSNNLLFNTSPPYERATIIDWQFPMWGNPLSDLAVLLFSSLNPDDRRKWSDMLIRFYWQTLTKISLVSYTIEDCYADYYRSLKFAGVVCLATLDSYILAIGTEINKNLTRRIEAIIEEVLRPVCV